MPTCWISNYLGHRAVTGLYWMGHRIEEHMTLKEVEKCRKCISYDHLPLFVMNYVHCTQLSSQVEVNKWQTQGSIKWGGCLVDPCEVLHNLDDIVNTNCHLQDTKLGNKQLASIIVVPTFIPLESARCRPVTTSVIETLGKQNHIIVKKQERARGQGGRLGSCGLWSVIV